MNLDLNILIGLAMGLNLLALGSSRIPVLIGTMALQGVVLGLMPVLMEHELDWRVALVSLATVAGKGLVIPAMLRHAMRSAQIDREMEPLLGFVPSLLLGAGGAIADLLAIPHGQDGVALKGFNDSAFGLHHAGGGGEKGVQYGGCLFRRA